MVNYRKYRLNMNEYFYLDEHNLQHGPVSPYRFTELGVTANTLVWRQGMDEWTPAESVSELRDFVRSATQEQPNTAYNNPPPPPFTQKKPEDMPPCPDNYMAFAILTTICCCLPFGVVAIVKASKVNPFYLNGHYDQAVLASSDARTWCFISLVCGLFTAACSSIISLLH